MKNLNQNNLGWVSRMIVGNCVFIYLKDKHISPQMIEYGCDLYGIPFYYKLRFPKSGNRVKRLMYFIFDKL